MHNEYLIFALALSDVNHDLLKKWEEHLDKVIERASLLVNSVLIRLQYLFQGVEARDKNGLTATLNTIANLLQRVLPVLWEVYLCHVVDHTAQSLSN